MRLHQFDLERLPTTCNDPYEAPMLASELLHAYVQDDGGESFKAALAESGPNTLYGVVGGLHLYMKMLVSLHDSEEDAADRDTMVAYARGVLNGWGPEEAPWPVDNPEEGTDVR